MSVCHLLNHIIYSIMLSDLLLWNKIGRIVTILSDRLGIPPEKALDLFYTSKACEQLHDPSTQLYLFSDGYIATDVINETRG